jgi:hypothetical protein
MLPTRYIPIDNNLQVAISQVRNDGSLNYSVSLQIDRDKYARGVNLIDSLILTAINTNTLLAPDTLDPSM